MSRNLIDWDDIENSIKKHLTHRPGWVPLVIELMETIKEHGDLSGDELPETTTIKQKLGGIRIYTRHSEKKYMNDFIHAAEIKAEHTCEAFGNAAKVQDFYGYLAGRCAWCAHDLIDERKGGTFFGTLRPEPAPGRCWQGPVLH